MAISFDGMERITIADSPSLFGAAVPPFTFTAWLNWSGVFALPAFPSATIMTKDAFDGAPINGYFWTINSFGAFDVLSLWNGAAFFDSTVPMPSGSYTHVATTFDGVTIDHFINGAAAGSLPAASALVANVAPLLLSDRADAPALLSYIGSIEDLRIYNRILSAEEIQTMSTVRGIDGIVDGLVARYNMREEPVGTVTSGILDASQFANNSIGVLGTPDYVDGELRFKRRYR